MLPLLMIDYAVYDDFSTFLDTMESDSPCKCMAAYQSSQIIACSMVSAVWILTSDKASLLIPLQSNHTIEPPTELLKKCAQDIQSNCSTTDGKVMGVQESAYASGE